MKDSKSDLSKGMVSLQMKKWLKKKTLLEAAQLD